MQLLECRNTCIVDSNYFAEGFFGTSGSKNTTVRSCSLINSTFAALVYDAVFNYQFSASKKDKISDAYYGFILNQLPDSAPQTIYLAGHSLVAV